MQNAAPTASLAKGLVIGLFGLVAVAYLGGYFFLLSLRLAHYQAAPPPYFATPLTIPKYAYYYWDRRDVRVRIVSSSALALLLVGGFGLIALLPKKKPLHGDAKFASSRQIRKAGLFSQDGLLVGRHGKRYLTWPGQGGLLLEAPPRSGKGVSIVVPNLLNWPGSVLVLDIKQENWRLTAGYRSNFSDTHLLDPLSETGTTARWNPLDYVSSNPFLRIDDIQRIASMLCQEVPGADPFWVKSSRSLFVGIALYLFERRDYERAQNADPHNRDKIPEVPVTVGEILRLAMASDEEGFNKHLKRIIDGWAGIDRPLSPQCVALIMDLVDLAPQTASSVRKTFTSQLDLWLNPLLDMATSASDFDLRELRTKKLSIYIGIKPRDFVQLMTLMNLFFQQALGEQTKELPEDNPAIKYRLLLALDEVTSIGKIPALVNSMGFIPGYDIVPLLVVQTASQFDEVYGPHGRKIIQKALTARIVFAPNNMEDARNICAELGDTTVKVRSRNVPGFGGGQNRSPSTTISEQRRALMLPQELKAMQRTEQLFLLDYLQTVKCKRIEYYTDPVFKARVLPPPIVRSHDVTRFTGVRADDRFAMWQDKILKARRASAPAGTVSVPRAMPEVPPVQTKTGLSQRSEVAPASRFSLDFSQVEIPAGRYLSPSEVPAAVEAFMDDLEASEASLADAAA